MRITTPKLVSIGLGLAACAAATAAFAGRVYHNQVYVYSYTGGGGFSGTVTGARYSADSTQEISCQTDAFVGQTPEASCWARDAAGNYSTCFTTDPGLVATARTVNSESFLNVTMTTNGQCYFIGIQNGSLVLP
jgi:hypothetical protein